MEKIDNAVKEAVSNVSVENKSFSIQELTIIKEALEEKDKSFLKTLYEKVKEKNANKRN